MSETEVFKVSFFTAEDMIQNEVKATITAAKTDAITANFFPLVFFTVSFSLADTFLSGSISISGIFSALSSGGISGSEFIMLFFFTSETVLSWGSKYFSKSSFFSLSSSTKSVSMFLFIVFLQFLTHFYK